MKYRIVMEVVMQGTSPTGTKYPQRNRFDFETSTVLEIWRWVNRKRRELERQGFSITSATYKVMEV